MSTAAFCCANAWMMVGMWFDHNNVDATTLFFVCVMAAVNLGSSIYLMDDGNDKDKEETKP